MGRPKGSKNKTKKQKTKEKKPAIKTVKSSPAKKVDYSFDLDTITCLDTTFWHIRQELIKLILEEYGHIECIPREAMVSAFTKLGLERFTYKEDDRYD